MSFLSLIMQNITSISSPIGILVGLAAIMVCLIIAGFIIYRQQQQRKALLQEIQNKQQDLVSQLQAIRAKNVHQKLDTTFAQAYRERVREDLDLRETRGVSGKPFDLQKVYTRVWLSWRPKQKAAPPHRMYSSLVEGNTSKEDALDPRDVIKRHHYCVFLGEPGSGKTTLLKKLSLEAINEELPGQYNLPIFVDLYHFAKELMENKTDAYQHNGKNAQTLLEYIARKQGDRYEFKAADIQGYLENILEGGNALVLLDGLDETLLGKSEQEANKSYETVSRIILELATCYRHSAFVVTCRQAVYKTWGTIGQFAQDKNAPEFTQFEINPFLQEEVKEFVEKRWNQMGAILIKEHTDDPMFDDFMNELRTKSGLGELASNPLFLESMIEAYWKADFITGFPSDIAGIYDVMADHIFKDWDRIRKKNRFKEVSTIEMKTFLAEVAWYSAYHSQFCPKNLLRDIAIRVLPDSAITDIDTIEKELLACSGFLQTDGTDWRFSQHVWNNYFAALAVVYETGRREYEGKLEKMLKKKDHILWEEIIELYSAYTEDISPLLCRLAPRVNEKLGVLPRRNPLRESLFEPNVVLAGKYAVYSITRESTRASRSQEARDQVFQESLPEELQKTPYALICEKIVQAMAKYASLDRGFPLFEAMKIENKEPAIAQQIIQSLYDEGVKNNKGNLAGDLHNLTQKLLNPDVQKYVLELLRELGNLSVIFELLTLDLLPGSPLRKLIVDVFGAFDYGEASLASKDKEHLDTSLREILTKDPDTDLRVKIARMLGRIREPELPFLLISLLSNQQLNLLVRCSLAVALGLQGKRDGAVIGKLKSLLDEKEPLPLRIYCALALLALDETEDWKRFSWLSSFATIGKTLQIDILDTVVQLQLQTLSADLFEIVKNTPFAIDVRVKAVTALFKLAEGKEAGDVVYRLPELLPLKQVSKEEELYVAILACLVDWKTGQKKEVSSYLRSLSWQEDLISTKNLWAALTLARYVYGEREVLPELLRLSLDKQVHASLRRHILRKLTTLIGSRKEVESNQVLRSICNQDFAQDLLTELLNSQKQEAPLADEPLAWYNDLIPDTHEANCIADLLFKIEPILSDELQDSLGNQLCEKLVKELPRGEDNMRRYRCMANVLTQFAGRKGEPVKRVIKHIVQRLRDLENHVWQNTSKEAEEIAQARDEREVASILLDTLNTIQKNLEMGEPFLWRDRPGGKIYIDFKYTENPSNQQREQAPAAAQQQERASLTM